MLKVFVYMTVSFICGGVILSDSAHAKCPVVIFAHYNIGCYLLSVASPGFGAREGTGRGAEGAEKDGGGRGCYQNGAFWCILGSN